MDSNNMYQNQQSGGQNPDNTQNNNQNGNQGGYYQNTYTQGDNSQNVYSNPNPGYQATQYNNGYQSAYQPMQTDLEEPVTMGEWLITILIMMVPCVNIVMMFVWAFGSGSKKSKSNYFRATLIFAAIYLVLVLIFGSAILNILSNMKYYY